MIVGKTSSLRYYQKSNTITKDKLWQSLKLHFLLPNYHESKVSKEEMLTLIQFPNMFFLLDKNQILMKYISTGVLIHDLHRLICRLTLKYCGLLWPFSQPFDMHYLQNCLRVIDIEIFEKIFAHERKYFSLEIPPKYVNVPQQFSTVFIQRSSRALQYEEAYNLATSELLTDRFKNIRDNTPDPNSYVKKRLRMLAHAALRIFEECNQIPQLLSSYGAKIKKKILVIDTKVKTEYRIIFRPIYGQIIAHLDQRPISYTNIYRELSLKEGLNMPIEKDMAMKELLSRDESRLANSLFSDNYRSYMSRVISGGTNAQKCEYFCTMVSIDHLLSYEFREPELSRPSQSENMTRYTLLFVFLLFCHLIKLQKDMKIKIMLDIYRHGMFNASENQELSMAYEAVSILMIEGIQNLKIPLSFNHVFLCSWFEKIVKGYFICKLNIAKMKMLSDIKTPDADKLSLYGILAYSIKVLVLLQEIYNVVLKPKSIYGDRLLFERAITCFPLPDSHKGNFENMLSLILDVLNQHGFNPAIIEQIKKKANVYDVEIIINIIKSRVPGSDLNEAAVFLSKVHKVREQWLRIIDALIKPATEVRYLLSQHIPNARLRTYITQNDVMGKNFLQQFITAITCCEALLIQDPQNVEVYQAIICFAKESEDAPFYFQVLRELCFMLENSFFQKSNGLNIKDYLRSLKNSTLTLGLLEAPRYMNKKNYIYLIPDVMYNQIGTREDVRAVVNRITSIDNTEAIAARRPPKNSKAHFEEYCAAHDIKVEDIILLNLESILLKKQQVIHNELLYLLSFGIPPSLLEKLFPPAPRVAVPQQQI